MVSLIDPKANIFFFFPPPQTNPLAFTGGGTEESKDYDVYYPEAKTFDELPLSTRTKNGWSYLPLFLNVQLVS